MVGHPDCAYIQAFGNDCVRHGVGQVTDAV
jgi:hypothetical protein